MRNNRHYVYLYHIIGKHLPKSYAPVFGKFGTFVRRKCAQKMLPQCGKKVNIEKGAEFSTKSTIGDFSGIGINASFGEVHIGENVLMGRDCIGITRNHGFMQKDTIVKRQGYLPEEPIYIGNDVWIGHRVTILPGVHIGNGCVIGAGSVVTKDTPEYSVVAGNHAKVIKYRE